MRISRDCFANLLVDFHMTFMRVSHECCENFHVLRTSHELVGKVFNRFKNFMQILPKYCARLSRNCRATLISRSCKCCEPVAAKLWQIYNAKFLRHLYELCTNVVRQLPNSLEKTCNYLARK